MKTLIFGFIAVAAFGFRVSAQERFVSEEAQNRKAIMEEYTAIHCGYCPAGHQIANQLTAKYPGDVFVMNIHEGSLAVPSAGEVDLRTSYGSALSIQAGVAGYPSASINRHVFSGNSTAVSRGSWASAVNQVLQMPSYVNIAAKAVLDWETRELTVKVQLYYTGKSDYTVNFLNVAVLQDNIIGTQSGGSTNPDQLTADGKYIHMHAFRDFLTGQWGDSVTTTAAGSFVEKTYKKTLPEVVGNVDLSLGDLHILAFVAENREEIMNVCEAEVEHVNGPVYLADLSDLKQVEDPTCDNNIRLSFTFNNRISAVPVTSITFSYENGLGGQGFVYESETALEAGKRYVLTTDPLPISKLGVSETVKLKLEKINGEPYTEKEQNLQADVVKYYGYSTSREITVNILQDKYGSDITWNLKNAAGDQVAQGGPYTDLSANGTRLHTANVTLADGCHVFRIYDKNHDGINGSYGAGNLNISDAAGNPVVAHDGKYRDSLVMAVRYSQVANEPVDDRTNAVLVPNPASEYSLLKFELLSDHKVRIRVWQANGSCAVDLGERLLGSGQQEVMIPVNTLNEGLYFVTLHGDGLDLTRKLVVTK